MGGKALKHLNVRRFKSDEYVEVTNEIIECFEIMFKVTPTLIPSYFDKPDHGDADMLVCIDKLPHQWWIKFAIENRSLGWVSNGPVVSVECDGLQVDFITTNEAYFERALAYFSYNDLGNLMGRVAHKLGFKYGHKGLTKVIRDGDHVIIEVEVTDNLEQIFDFLDYDYLEFKDGFETLDQIFNYVASSRYFHPDIYLLHNVNAVSRIRDAKRETYTKFLEWCDYHKADQEPYDNTAEAKTKRYEIMLEEAYVRWPDFERRVCEYLALYEQQKDRKTRWNGTNVMKWTGIRGGRKLGRFMAYCQELKAFEENEHSLKTLEAYVKERYKNFQKEDVF